MLQALAYSVEFPTTGRSFQNRIEFAPGLTAITGRNEAGKTLIVEMIGYALFGSSALRGLATDYRNLSVQLSLIVKGQEWVIDRAKKETFTVDGETVAVGAAAINAEVPKLLGFDLNVFNIACAAQQGDLGALTDMRPTARRQMVDRLIGLDLLENIEKDCKQEAKTNETVAMSLLMSAPAPTEPVRPEGYEPSEKLLQISDEVQAHEAERARLSQVGCPVKPEEPTNPNLDLTVGELEEHEEMRNVALQDQARLQGRLAGMPVPTCSREDLQRAVDYKAYQDEVRRRGPMPRYGLDELQEFAAIKEAKDRVALVKQVQCPDCNHEFHPGVSPEDEALATQVLPLSGAEINADFRRHELWELPLDEPETFELPNLQQEILAHAHADDRAAVETALASLTVPVDRSADLRAARAYQNELAVYGERARQYDRQLADWQDAQARLDALADRSGELVTIQGRLAAARHFEQLRDRWLRDCERYEEVRAQAEASRELGEGFNKGVVSLRAARSRVKQELAPSLSKAASSLLYTMTGGERRHVDVDHDLNITVDGQPLQTLSGSGKSVVNLALRIGLGQVLTSKVLPIFMGDEVDKDMDQARASTTHNTFQSLREYLTQIILVTHKEVEADQVIQL